MGSLIKVRGGGLNDSICGGGCFATGIIHCHTGHLAAAGLGTLAAGEITRSVTDGLWSDGGHIDGDQDRAAYGRVYGNITCHTLIHDAGVITSSILMG
jgi:hypothetical protein